MQRPLLILSIMEYLLSVTFWRPVSITYTCTVGILVLHLGYHFRLPTISYARYQDYCSAFSPPVLPASYPIVTVLLMWYPAKLQSAWYPKLQFCLVLRIISAWYPGPQPSLVSRTATLPGIQDTTLPGIQDYNSAWYPGLQLCLVSRTTTLLVSRTTTVYGSLDHNSAWYPVLQLCLELPHFCLVYWTTFLIYIQDYSSPLYPGLQSVIYLRAAML